MSAITFDHNIQVSDWITHLSEPAIEVFIASDDDGEDTNCVLFYKSEVEALIAALEVRLRELKGEE